MSYSEKLKVPDWQRKRLEIFQRDQWKCTKCGAVEKELHVHHVDYIPDLQPWDYPNDMLKTLCHKCHGEETERPKHEKYLLHSLKMKGFHASDILRFSCLVDQSPLFVESIKIVLRKDQ